jgi:hypothetical protein
MDSEMNRPIIAHGCPHWTCRRIQDSSAGCDACFSRAIFDEEAMLELEGDLALLERDMLPDEGQGEK